MDWGRGRASSSGLFAIFNGMPYLFVLFHRKGWRAQAVGTAFGFSIGGGVLALFVSMLAGSSDQQGSFIGILVMNVVLLATSVMVWVAERGQLRTVVVILFALCALFYIPFLFTGFTGH